MGTNFLLKEYIGLTSCRKDTVILKKMIKVLKKDFKKNYIKKRKAEHMEHNKSSEEEKNVKSPPEITVPAEFYKDVMVDNIKVKKRLGACKSAKMRRFYDNHEIVERLFTEEGKDINFVAKWLKMRPKDLLK